MKQLELLVNGKTYRVEVTRTSGEIARVIVNGKQYDVVIKDLPGAGPSAASPVGLPRQIAPEAVSFAQPKHDVVTTEGVTIVKAPLPGLILDVKVKVGDDVHAGDTLVVIETMKMENNVTSPVSGRINEIRVMKDQTVSEGTPLIIISE